MSVDEVKAGSEAVANRFFEAFDLNAIRVLDVFIPITKFNELDTSPIYKGIWSEFPRVITSAPRVDHERGHLDYLAFAADTAFAENKWGISEPDSGVGVDEAAIDMVLVPLLCFDLEGHRVGYGKGFYDRFLARCRPDCIKVGLGYFPPVDRVDDLADHDIRLDHVVTPDAVFDFE
jgi:5-formyltetrahydrofolate cyclo-ligase